MLGNHNDKFPNTKIPFCYKKRHKFCGNQQKRWNNMMIRQILWSRAFTFYLKKSKKIQKLIDFNG